MGRGYGSTSGGGKMVTRAAAPRPAITSRAKVAPTGPPAPVMTRVKTPAAPPPASSAGSRYGATNMGPKGFTPAQKAQIAKRREAKQARDTATQTRLLGKL